MTRNQRNWLLINALAVGFVVVLVAINVVITVSGALR